MSENERTDQPAGNGAEAPAKPAKAPKRQKERPAEGPAASGSQQAPKGDQPAKAGKPQEAKPRDAKGRDAKPRDGEGKPDKDAEAPLRRTQPVRLRERYRSDVMPKLRDRFRYRNVMEVPKLEKVVVNVRVGDATTDTRFVDKAVEELSAITGQRPAVARARKSIAAFKLRQGMPIAARVTLRGDRMYEFVDKLFSVALPRIKDFKGISERQFDGRGNLNIGVREQLIFPEIEYDKVEKIRGMDITLVTTAKTDEEARELLRLMGLPLREAAAQS
jgi:large subunit ribosomal protein L5